MKQPAFLLTLSIVGFSCSFSAAAGVLDRVWLRGVTDKDPVSYHAGEEIVFTVSPMDLDGPIPPGAYQLEWRYSDEGGKAGLGDYTCPPRGIAAFWNALECDDASIRWVQGSTHGHVPPPYDGRDTTRTKRD